MIYARLAYRPGSVQELRYLLRYLRKQEIKQQFANNTMSLILRSLQPGLGRELYSDFADGMDHADKKDAQKASDEEEKKQVHAWLMGGDSYGSIHT